MSVTLVGIAVLLAGIVVLQVESFALSSMVEPEALPV